jgi:hypothetical protein
MVPALAHAERISYSAFVGVHLIADTARCSYDPPTPLARHWYREG